ncbi:DUF3168 domain-containing protein [Caulobacter sp. BK020]|uniref:DUF3168 domain-containing protein n=1 Tax=Caulobacter sp. BK020 TaxID=2512117 RepID=UPI0010479F1F|nr:DUF3168 domain-containing protein [Caulobacter sp. BK020]TCS12116.1 uncharacterized protein DUF3168 [Caulobacter sp. BK020]
MSGPLNADAAIAAALVQALKAASAVSALVAARVHADAPRHPVYPCVSLGRQESRPFGPDADGLEHLLTVTCASKYGGPEEARAVTSAVRAALHNAPLAVAGRRLVTLRVTYADVFRAADRELSLGVLRVRAVTESA